MTKSRRSTPLALGSQATPTSSASTGQEVLDMSVGAELDAGMTVDLQGEYGNDYLLGLVGTSTSTSSSAPPASPTATGGADAGIPPGFDPAAKADQLHAAMGGWGTDERGVLDVLYTGREDLVRSIESAYLSKYGTPLADALKSELSGAQLDKALRLLDKGDLSLAEKIREGAAGWGTDEDHIYHALERATPDELAAVRADPALLATLQSELSGDDWALAAALLEGKGALSAGLQRATGGLGTDEDAIWRSLSGASAAEKAQVLANPELMAQLEGDLGAADWTRAQAMLRGELDNADRIQVAMAGWGTDEDGLIAAISGLTATEYARLPPDISERIESELSGRTLELARDALHQRRLDHDPAYRAAYMKRQEAALGEGALQHAGASALIAQEGQAQSSVARLMAATAGMGTDDTTVWEVLSTLNASEREFIRTMNPDGVLDALRGDLGEGDFDRAMAALGGGAAGARAVLQQAVEGWGTDEKLIYNAIDRAATEGAGAEILADPALMDAMRGDLSGERMAILSSVLASGGFSSRQRLAWATTDSGTDEELIFALCARHGAEWRSGDGIAADVDALLKAELSTSDYWTAKDKIRGEPQTEQEHLERKKEQLERERGSALSAGMMDMFSTSGENADDAWREYQGSYNRAYTDGQVTEEEVSGLRRDEAFSEQLTGEYRQTKAAAAQWATQIAVAVTGIAATILTAGAAGPLVAGLAASMGGNTASAAEMMILAAASKVGLNRAILGEGYDLTSADALIDAASASIEVGLSMVGGQVTKAAMEGLGKTAMAARVSASVEQVFGGAGQRILGAGVEGALDGALGGFGEGVVSAASKEETWEGDAEAVAGKFGGVVFQKTAMSAGTGFLTQAAFKSLTEVYGAAARARKTGQTAELGDDPALHETPGDGEEVLRKTQEDKLPELRGEHSAYGYKEVESGKAFVQGEGDAFDIDPNDVKQGQLGDCYLMAGMAATARANPDSIRHIIKDNGDGTFEVTLFIRENSWSPPKAITRTVDARLPTKGGSSLLYAGVGDATGEGKELWPSLLEKTMAQHKESYELISGGNVGKNFEFHGATELFTGKSERYFATSSLGDDKVMQMMEAALGTNKPITVDSMNMENLPDLSTEANKVNVYGNHAYAVKSVDVAKGTVTLQNPWGSHDVVDLPIKDFKRFYRALRVGGG